MKIKEYILTLGLTLAGTLIFAATPKYMAPESLAKNTSHIVAEFDEDDWEIVSPGDYNATIVESTFGKDSFTIKNTSRSTWLEVIAIVSPDNNTGDEFRLRSSSTTRHGETITWKNVYNFKGKLGTVILVARVK